MAAHTIVKEIITRNMVDRKSYLGSYCPEHLDSNANVV
jgi:hypothetical protein